MGSTIITDTWQTNWNDETNDCLGLPNVKEIIAVHWYGHIRDQQTEMTHKLTTTTTTPMKWHWPKRQWQRVMSDITLKHPIRIKSGAHGMSVAHCHMHNVPPLSIAANTLNVYDSIHNNCNNYTSLLACPHCQSLNIFGRTSEMIWMFFERPKEWDGGKNQRTILTTKE